MSSLTRIRAGEFRHRIIIVKPTGSLDTAGGWRVDDENTFATVWAKIEAVTGRELYAAQQIVSEVTHKISIRWISGVTATMSVWFENRQFEIQAIQNPDERHKLLILLCVERDNSAREKASSAV